MYKQRSDRGTFARQKSSNGNGRKSSRQPKKQFIHESKFINHTVAQPSRRAESYVPTHRFADFALAPKIQKNLEYLKYMTPTAIQDQTIPLALQGRDVIGLANTGTGKTAAFLLPIINALSKKSVPESVLILAPTRELATQIDEEFRKFAAGMKLYSVLLVGGVNITPQLRNLARGPHVVIGTPGRVKDHIERRSLRLGVVNTFVLDEADRMLDMGFVKDIRQIASLLPVQRQTLCFSATFSDGVRAIAQDFMDQPEYVSVKVTETNDHIYQDVVRYSSGDHKKELLMDMLHAGEFEKMIIFGDTKYGVQRLSDTIEKAGITSRAIHGNKSQSQRDRALRDFKTAKARVLVATDVAARGLDIPNVSHVVNFDTPTTYDDYVHRIGRTGRGGQNGMALTFVGETGAAKPAKHDRPQPQNWREKRPFGPQQQSQKPRRPRTSRQNEASLLAAIEELQI